MKVLFLSDSCDFKKGKGVVSKNNLEILNEIYGIDSVSVFSLKGISRHNDFKKTGNNVFEYQGYNGRYHSLLNLIMLKHNHLSLKIEKEFLKVIDNFDLVFIDDSNFGRLNRICAKRHIRSVCFFHNIRRDLSKKWLKYYGYKYLPSYLATLYNEKCAVKFADITITLNKRDSLLYEEYYQCNPTINLPIQIKDTVYSETAQEIEPRLQDDILFVGADYYPNIEGVRWFISNILPELKDKKLKIVGFGMEKYKSELEDNNKVVVLGTVDDLSIHYRSASIVVMPIFEGGGMKVKTAEALMYGNIIVGTKESFVGYNMTKHMFESNNKEEFLLNIGKAFHISHEFNGFSQLNRETYNRNHSFLKAVDEMKEILL